MSESDRRKFEGDVAYEAWRRGLNPDRAVECADDCYWDRKTPEECVEAFARKERARREARRAAEEAQYPEQQYREQQYPEEP